MTIDEAIQEVMCGIRPGLRGVGAAVIEMADGQRYSLMSEFGGPLLERFTDEGDLVERRPAADITGDVEWVRWCVDESGAIVMREEARQ
jgi:hypothetical protein